MSSPEKNGVLITPAPPKNWTTQDEIIDLSKLGFQVFYIEEEYQVDDWAYIIRIADILKNLEYDYVIISFSWISEMKIEILKSCYTDTLESQTPIMIQLLPTLRKQMITFVTANFRALATTYSKLKQIGLKKNIRAIGYLVLRKTSTHFNWIRIVTEKRNFLSKSNDHRAKELGTFAEMRLIGEVELLMTNKITIECLREFKAGNFISTQNALIGISRAGTVRTLIRL